MASLHLSHPCGNYNEFGSKVFVLSRFRWPRGQRHGSTAARFLGLLVRILLVAWVSVSHKCCVLAGMGRSLVNRSVIERDQVLQ